VVIELDEMWHYLKKSPNPFGSGRLGIVLQGGWWTGNAAVVTRPPVSASSRLRRWRTRLYCADDYAVHDVLLPVGQLHTGKDETHGVERDNARQRHWLARFRRRSIVVSKANRMVDVSIALFARFAGNAKISDLISMLG
jgi:insertion element IS1 protein InsB